MFKKLKEKITEEVKSSPQRFQQLTQTVSDKLQGTISVEDSMFSIGEDDENTASKGFTNVALVSPSKERRLSNASMASDISFLPRYEPTNSSYHLQSDLDISASEMEDNVSQSSSKFGHITKEQVFAEYRKSQMRYHKYRGRYTDLAKHYKELERENDKMKSVLEETQDKSLRRVSELKEQCLLEQKAKAHLEKALRDEMEEKQMTIDSLRTKIMLLQKPNQDDAGRVDSEQLTKYLNDARNEIESLNVKLQEFKANSIIFQTKEDDYKSKIATLEKDLKNFAEREKENNLKLAENKMELHNELIGKDSEISKLKAEIEHLKSDNKSTKLENLQSQNTKLIEKLESLNQKCQNFESELLKSAKIKLDNEALTAENEQLNEMIQKLKQGLTICQENLKQLSEEKEHLLEVVREEKLSYQNQIDIMRESAKKGLFTLEHQISETIRTEYKRKEVELTKVFEAKLRNVAKSTENKAELQLQLVENERVIKKLLEELQNVKIALSEKQTKYTELETSYLELIEESSQLRVNNNNLQKDIDKHSKTNEKHLAKIYNLEGSLKELEKVCEAKEQQNVELAKESLDFQTTNTDIIQKSRLLEEREEASEMEIIENNLLEMKVQALERERDELVQSFEIERKLFNKILEEHNQMKVLELSLQELEDINKKLEGKVVKLKGYLKEKEHSLVEVNKLKLNVEKELEKTKEQLRIKEEYEEAVDMEKTECNLLQIKVQQLENEKINLQKSFEREREVFDQSFHPKHQEVINHEDVSKENLELSKENLELKEINEQLTGKLRLFEGKQQGIELESCECNLLKLKLQQLEAEKVELLKSFEVERELFNKISTEHNELKLREQHIQVLESSNHNLIAKIAKLKTYLTEKEEFIVKLQKNVLAHENTIRKLTESLKLKEEEIDSIEIEKTECDLLQMKLQALEQENLNLLKSFEIERSTLEDALAKGSQIEDLVDELRRENEKILQEKSDGEETSKIKLQDLMDCFEVERRNFRTIENEVKKLNQENLLLKEEKDNINTRKKEEFELLEEQVTILKEETERLQTINEKLRKELDLRQEKLEAFQEDAKRQETKYKTLTETLKVEKLAKKDAIKQLEDMKKVMDKNNSEIMEIRRSLEHFEKLYNEAKGNLTDFERIKQQLQTANEANTKLDESFQALAKGVEGLETENRTLSEEAEKLRPLLVKSKEADQLKSQNEVLQEECGKLNQEISELKVRISQLSSDNRNINEEHDKLLAEMEGYKAKCEFLEREKPKDNFQEIQSDYVELKTKFDKLYLDNQNLCEEYEKLISQTMGFDKTKQELETQLLEVEKHYNEVLHEKQLLLDEVQELKISPILNNTTAANGQVPTDLLQKENDTLREKVTQYKSLDLTNKSSIEFYENELQKMKSKNEKLGRKLDETLVTLNHCAELSNSTEVEYLKNVLYNYMLGKEGMVLARVIAAVCKFDPAQTEAVLQKEQQKQTLDN